MRTSLKRLCAVKDESEFGLDPRASNVWTRMIWATPEIWEIDHYSERSGETSCSESEERRISGKPSAGCLDVMRCFPNYSRGQQL